MIVKIFFEKILKRIISYLVKIYHAQNKTIEKSFILNHAMKMSKSIGLK